MDRRKRFLQYILKFGLLFVFLLMIMVGLDKEYGLVQSFVQFLCRACVGLDG